MHEPLHALYHILRFGWLSSLLFLGLSVDPAFFYLGKLVHNLLEYVQFLINLFSKRQVYAYILGDNKNCGYLV